MRFVANRSGRGGRKRIIGYVLAADMVLDAMQELASEFGLDLNGVEEIRGSVQRVGLPGWVIPNNYPDGDDILIVDTGVLEYRGTDQVECEAQKNCERGDLSVG